MYIAITCFPGCDIINFLINLFLLIKPFFYINKKSRQKLNILRTKRAFKTKYKAFFTFFKGLSVAKNRLRSESAPLAKMREMRSFKNGCNGGGGWKIFVRNGRGSKEWGVGFLMGDRKCLKSLQLF